MMCKMTGMLLWLSLVDVRRGEIQREQSKWDGKANQRLPMMHLLTIWANTIRHRHMFYVSNALGVLFRRKGGGDSMHCLSTP